MAQLKWIKNMGVQTIKTNAVIVVKFEQCDFAIEYHYDPKFSDRYAWANSADPDQSLIRVYTVWHSVCIVWTHYSMVESHSSNFRLITTNVLGVRIFRKITVIHPKEDDGMVPFRSNLLVCTIHPDLSVWKLRMAHYGTIQRKLNQTAWALEYKNL